MRILTVIGARPQFIKASVVSRAIQTEEAIEEIIVHTGQHFDANMSDVFFNQLDIPRPHYQLDIHGGGHGSMTGRMLEKLEAVMLEEKPDRVLVYGDTNSTLAGALAGAKLRIPVAHVEAGLRSFNRNMPEEINRILTDQVSDLLFCPTSSAVGNLEQEGFRNRLARVVQVGDVMQDAALFFAEHARCPKEVSVPGEFILATLHRAENTDDAGRLSSLVNALNQVHKNIAPVILPLHPRTRAAIQELGLDIKIKTIDPVGYLEMLWLLAHCGLVMTDSGGLQKEAFFFGRACVTLRDQTEWVELVEIGANQLVGADAVAIFEAVKRHYGRNVEDNNSLYGGGDASVRIVETLIEEAQ